MANSPECILVIDDDRVLSELLGEYLAREGFGVEAAYDGITGVEKAMSGKYVIIVLDVMLPGGQDGFTVLREVRARINTPVLMLTARGDDVDRISGLEAGADDYLAKPFNPRELVARLRAILRRSNSGTSWSASGAKAVRYKVGDLELDMGTRTVYRNGDPVELTAVEFSLLEIFLYKVGRLVTRDELTRTVLGRTLTPYDRSIDVHVSKLRKKLGPSNDGLERIKSIRGSGYLYVLPQPPGLAMDGRRHNGDVNAEK